MEQVVPKKKRTQKMDKQALQKIRKGEADAKYNNILEQRISR